MGKSQTHVVSYSFERVSFGSVLKQPLMKTLKSMVTAVTLGLVLSTAPSATAAVFSLVSGSGTPADPGFYTGGGSSLGQVIPDNTPAGVGYSINFGASGLTISDISVTINVSGGYNGDLYAYVTHGDQIAYLLSANPAVSSSGFNNVTFVVGTGTPIPTGGSGQLTDTSYTGVNNLNVFNDTDPNGDWTLFFADVNPGDTSTLNRFSIGITAVPEPTTWGLVAFAVVFGTVQLRRLYRRRVAAAV